MQIELVAHNSAQAVSGIGRYVREIHQYLTGAGIPIHLTEYQTLGLAERFGVLKHFPTGVKGHQAGRIVHFTQIMGCAMMLWRPVRPAVSTVHDLGLLVCEEDKLLFNRPDGWVIRRQFDGLRHMDFYAVNSEQTKRHLVEILGVDEDRISHVQLGVDVEQFRPVPDPWARLSAQYGLHPLPDGFNLIYVGSELPRKNLGLVLEAMAALKRRGYRLRLFKIGKPGGDVWREATCAQIARLGLEEEVILLGAVPEEDLPVFYNASDLAVTATLLEGGFAWVAMEALACGTPVLASRGALIPADVLPAARVVPDRDLTAFTDALAALLDDSAQRTIMGETGRRILQGYTWRRTVEEMLAVYRRAETGG